MEFGFEVTKAHSQEPQNSSEESASVSKDDALDQAPKRVNTVLRRTALNSGIFSLICGLVRCRIAAESRLNFLRSVLRSSKILLQNRAILRNTLRMLNRQILGAGNAVQRCEKLRNSLGLN